MLQWTNRAFPRRFVVSLCCRVVMSSFRRYVVVVSSLSGIGCGQHPHGSQYLREGKGSLRSRSRHRRHPNRLLPRKSPGGHSVYVARGVDVRGTDGRHRPLARPGRRPVCDPLDLHRVHECVGIRVVVPLPQRRRRHPLRGDSHHPSQPIRRLRAETRRQSPG